MVVDAGIMPSLWQARLLWLTGSPAHFGARTFFNASAS
jgi:hypothetical protein